MDSREEKFEPWRGNGNGHESREIGKNPEKMFRSTLGTVLSEIQELEKSIGTLLQLALHRKEIGEGGRKDIIREVELMNEKLAKLVEDLKTFESEIAN